MEEEAFGKLTEEELDAGIRVYSERIMAIQKALECNVDYPTEREKCELKIASLKDKKGVFFSLYKKYLEYKLKMSIGKPAKKLSKHSRKLLEEKLDKYKKRVNNLYATKSYRQYEVK